MTGMLMHDRIAPCWIDEIHGDNLDHLSGFRIRIWISVMTVLWTNDNLSVQKKEKNKVDSCDCRARRSQMWCSFGMEQGWNAKMVHHHALGFWLFYVVLLFAVPVTVTTVLWSYHNSWTFRISLRFPQCPPSFSFYCICSNSVSQFLSWAKPHFSTQGCLPMLRIQAQLRIGTAELQTSWCWVRTAEDDGPGCCNLLQNGTMTNPTHIVGWIMSNPPSLSPWHHGRFHITSQIHPNPSKVLFRSC